MMNDRGGGWGKPPPLLTLTYPGYSDRLEEGMTMKRKSRLLRFSPWFLVVPALGLRCFTAILPLFQNFFISLRDLHLVKGTNNFVGLSNYVAIFRDPRVLDSISFTFIFTLFSTSFHFVFGVLIALLLNFTWRAKGVLRTVNLLPWAVPTIVMALAAQYMLQRDIGVVNDLYQLFTGARRDWLASIWGARFSVIFLDVWKNVPFLAIVVLAGLQGIPEEILEAARVDGASSMRIFFAITLPLLSPVLVTMLIFISLFRLLSFDIVYGLTKGGQVLLLPFSPIEPITMRSTRLTLGTLLLRLFCFSLLFLL